MYYFSRQTGFKKFEYEIIDIDLIEYFNTLRKQGEDGWELCIKEKLKDFMGGKERLSLTFKREIVAGNDED